MNNKIIGIFVCSLIIVSSFVPTAAMFDLSFRCGVKTVVSSQLVTATDDSPMFDYSILDAGNGYVRLVLENSSTYLQQPENPQIPRLVRHFELPFAATKVKVSLTVSGWSEQTISGVVVPAQDHVSYELPDAAASVDIQRNNEVYTSSELYPPTWFTYHVGCGLNMSLLKCILSGIDQWIIHSLLQSRWL
jgi:hypothetical protein